MSSFSFGRRLLPSAVALVFLALGLTQPAAARHWKPNPESEAMEYSQIVDSRGKDVVFLWWLAAPAFSDPTLDPILKKYFILGVVHAQMDDTGDIKFVGIDTPVVKDANNNALTLVKDDDQPPGVVTVVAGLRSVLTKMIGPMGNGMKLFVYKPGTVDACKPGKVTVPFNGETYTYDTPVPGCPKP